MGLILLGGQLTFAAEKKKFSSMKERFQGLSESNRDSEKEKTSFNSSKSQSEEKNKSTKSSSSKPSSSSALKKKRSSNRDNDCEIKYDHSYGYHRPLYYGGYHARPYITPQTFVPSYTVYHSLQPPRLSNPPSYDDGYYSDGYVIGQRYRQGRTFTFEGGLNQRMAYPGSTALFRRAQQQLAALGYYTGPIDGVIGTQTLSAIMEFQQDYRLPITGYLDRKTLAVLGL